MEIKWSTFKPPVWDDVMDAFPAARNKRGLLFAYGDTIYNPHLVNVSPSLEAHETIHIWQQINVHPREWWDTYIRSDKFRWECEQFAHLAEWVVESRQGNRHDRRASLHMVAAKLSADLYNWTPPVSQGRAARTLRTLRARVEQANEEMEHGAATEVGLRA